MAKGFYIFLYSHYNCYNCSQSPVPSSPQSILIQPNLHYDFIPFFLIKIFIKVGFQFLVKNVTIYEPLSSPKLELLEAAMLVRPDMEINADLLKLAREEL